MYEVPHTTVTPRLPYLDKTYLNVISKHISGTDKEHDFEGVHNGI